MRAFLTRGLIAARSVVALAAAWAVRESAGCPTGVSMFDFVLQHTPESPTRKGIEQARQVPRETPIAEVAERLGSGYKVMSVDSVPFVIWNAAHHAHSYPEAMWSTVAGLGDRDTTCAMGTPCSSCQEGGGKVTAVAAVGCLTGTATLRTIVGGIVVHTAGRTSLPQEWLARREPLIVGDWDPLPEHCVRHWTERGLPTYTLQPQTPSSSDPWSGV